MKLFEISQERDIQIGQEYVYVPDIITTAHKNYRVIGLVNGMSVSYYSIEADVINLEVRVLGIEDIMVDDHRVFRVRILNHPDSLLTPFNYDDVAAQSESIFIKNAPELINLDSFSDSSFFSLYDKIRKDDDHGLVGQMIDVGQFIPLNVANSDVDNINYLRDNSSKGGSGVIIDKDGSSKLDRAISIFKSNPTKPRKEIIRMYQRDLQMSKDGASSYYTKAKNAVENKKPD